MKRATPKEKRAVNLYLNSYLLAEVTTLLKPRYGLATVSDFFNEMLARELQLKGGLLRASLAAGR